MIENMDSISNTIQRTSFVNRTKYRYVRNTESGKWEKVPKTGKIKETCTYCKNDTIDTVTDVVELTKYKTFYDTYLDGTDFNKPAVNPLASAMGI